MYPELLHIGPLTVYTYGLMIAIGILMAYWIASKRVVKIGGSEKRLEWLTFSLLAGGFLGSKILYWITRLPDIPSDPSILWDLQDGWVVYGGIIGGLVGGYIYCKKHQMNFWQYADLILPVVALAQGFGRIGCFFAGCCYGIETDCAFSVVFPENSLAPSGVHLVPTQLIMSAFDFALFFLLSWLDKHKKFNGETSAVYLILYSIGRFIIEYFRGDLIRGHLGELSTSQWIAIALVIAGIAVLIIGRKNSKKKEANS